MKRIFIVTVFVIMIVTVVTACNATGDNQVIKQKDNATESDTGSEAVDEITKEEAAADEGQSTANEEQSEKDTAVAKDEGADSSLTTIDVRMADEVGGDVHLAWKSISSENVSGIEVCRAVSESGDYEVIATITDDYYGFLGDGYIDQGAAGKGFYYGVRLISGNSHGAIGQGMKAIPTKQSWYMNDNSYLCVVQQPEDPDYLIQFTEYDLAGNRTWNCDWPCTNNEDIFTWQVDETEHTRTFQYRFTTPMEYNEMGSEEFTYYADLGGDEFVLTMYSYDDELYLPVFHDTIYNKINE